MAKGRERWVLAAVGLGLLLPPAAPAAAEVLRISAADCRQITAHRPAPGIDYQAGQDVRGRSVAPANLGTASPLALPEAAHFLIEVDLIERLGLALDPVEIGADLPLGVVTVRDGDVRFNGQPLAPSVGQELADLCRAALAGADKEGRGASVVP